MKLSKYFPLGLAALIALLTTACKPTEANYRKAYDTAVQKKQKEASDPDIAMPGFKSQDVPNRVKVDSDSAYVRQEPLQVYGQGPAGPLHPYCVAVGRYRMPTNAEADAEALRAQGHNAFLIVNSDNEYYVVAGAFPTLNEAVAFMRRYMTANPERPYVGLPGEPVVEVPIRKRF